MARTKTRVCKCALRGGGACGLGCRYYVRRVSKPKERCALGLAVKVGSVNEEPGEEVRRHAMPGQATPGQHDAVAVHAAVRSSRCLTRWHGGQLGGSRADQQHTWPPCKTAGCGCRAVPAWVHPTHVRACMRACMDARARRAWRTSWSTWPSTPRTTTPTTTSCASWSASALSLAPARCACTAL